MLGFWSYVHKDDELDFGRVAQLARDIVGHYEAIRDEEIELFLDRDDFHWGDNWRDKANESLANVAFFVPVLTPRYFSSTECRREFQYFLDRTKKLGIPQLVLPILYIDVPGLHEDEPSDPLMVASKERQWEPWTHLRFTDRDSGQYRQAVNGLAEEIAARAAAIEQVDTVAVAQAAADDDGLGDDEPGPLDRIAALEEAMPRWNETIQAIGREVQEIGEIMRRSTVDANSEATASKGFAARLMIARRVASELDGPVARIEDLARSWVADLDEIDAGIRALVEQAESAYEEAPDVTVGFLESIKGLSLSSNQGLGSTLGLVQVMDPLANQSRDLRPVLRRLKKSLTSMTEARFITDEWLQLVDQTGLLAGSAGGAPLDLN
jgi:hypothetical protein